MTSSFTRFLDHTQRRTTVGRTPLDEWSARHRDFYTKTHTTDRQTCPLVGFFFLLFSFYCSVVQWDCICVVNHSFTLRSLTCPTRQMSSECGCSDCLHASALESLWLSSWASFRPSCANRVPLGFEPTISAGERQQTYTFRPRGHWGLFLYTLVKP
jgi:hypothetical protein